MAARGNHGFERGGGTGKHRLALPDAASVRCSVVFDTTAGGLTSADLSVLALAR